MKNFKIFLVETLIQLTILISISRYYSNDNNPFQELIQRSLIEFEKHDFIQNNNKKEFDFYQSVPTVSYNSFKGNFDFENNLSIDKNNYYLKEIIQNNRQRQYQLYLNPTHYLKVTDKFLEYPELQTKNALLSFCDNANISPEDMDAIKKILFEQDIDVGIDRSFYDPEYKTTQFEKNYTDKNDLNFYLQNSKQALAFKYSKPQFDDPVPEGFIKVVEEDTGEVFYITNDQTSKNDISIEPKTIVDTGANTLSPVTIEKYTNKGLEDFNDSFLDDLFLDNTSEVKLDDAWLKNFMEPTSLQTPSNENINPLTSFTEAATKEIPEVETLFDQQNDLVFGNLNNTDVISAMNNDNITYLDVNDFIDNILTNNTDKFTDTNLERVLENLINNSTFTNINDGNEIITLNNEIEQMENTTSSIISDSMESNNLLEDQLSFKEESTSEDALYGVMHNHTYLESNNEEVYHPHSYKNKMKNMLNATNKESRDEALLQDYKIQYSLDTIVNSNVDDFTEMLKNPNLTPEQLNVMKDIRRRGKNKIAAKTCRKRKIDSIENLKDDVDELKKKKRMLETEREKIQEQMKQFAKKIDAIYRELIGNNKDPSDPIKKYIENLIQQLNEKPIEKQSHTKLPQTKRK